MTHPEKEDPELFAFRMGTARMKRNSNCWLGVTACLLILLWMATL